MLIRKVDYFIEKTNCPKKAKIMIISDVHFEYADVKFDNENWKVLLRMARRERPEAIVIGGDLVDSLDFLDDKRFVELMQRRLRAMTKIAPVFVGVGNHEQCEYIDDGYLFAARKGRFELYKIMIEQTGAKVLDNSEFCDLISGVNFVGITLPPAYYTLTDFIEYGIEQSRTLEWSLRRVQHLLGQPGRFNIALIHSPILLDEEMLQFLPRDVDLVVSGHTHNGFVPIGLYDITRWSSRGILSPGMIPLAKHCRNTLAESNDRILTVGAVKTTGIYTVNRTICPAEVSFLHLEKTGEDGRRIQVARKYIRVQL